MKTRRYSHALAAAVSYAAATAFLAPSAFADQAAAEAAGVDLNVEYCESTGEQYIDTGILGNPGLRVEAEIMWTENITPNDDRHIIASFDKINNGATSWRCYPISIATNLCSQFCFGEYVYHGWFQYIAGKKYRVESEFGASAQSLTIDSLDGSPVYSNSLALGYPAVSSGQTLYLFAVGHGTKGVACKTMARIYWLKIYQNGTLVRDYRPACQGDVYGLWEDVNGTFCGSATATPFKTPATPPRTATGEPDFFAQWIQSNGSTYIDTGIIGRPETKIEATFQWKAIGDRRLISVKTGTGVSASVFHIACGESGQMWFRSGSSTVTIDGAAFAADTDYTVVSDVHASSQTYTVTGPFGTITTNDSQTAVNTAPNSFYIFAQNANGGDSEVGDTASRVRLYSMKIWQDGALVRDFVPGVKNGEGCLYDRVNDKCHFSGNGAITSAAGLVGPPAGTPAQPKYKLSYIGSEGNSYIDTGILGNPGLRVEAEVAWTDTTYADDHPILASFDNSSYGSGVSRRCYPISAAYDNGNLKVLLGVGSLNKAFDTYYAADRKYRIETEFSGTGQTLTIDGTSDFSNNNTFSQVETGKTLYMFATGHSSQASGMKHPTKARVYWMKIYQNGILVRDYVPVIADNGGPYLYDKATKSFHQGATSGFWDVGEVGERIAQGFTVVIR